MSSKAAACEPFLAPSEESKRRDFAAIFGALLNGALWTLVGSLLSRGVTLLAAIVVGRMMGVQGFGELGIIQNSAGMFGVFAGLGLGVTATRHIAEFRHGNPEKTSRILSMCYFLAISAGVAATVLIALAAPWLAREQLAAPQLSSTLRLGGGLVFLGAITGVQGGILTGFEAFQRQARINVTAALFSAPLLIIGVGYAGLNGGILALTGGLLLTAFLNHTAIRHLAREHGMRLWRSDAFQEFPVLGRFTLFAFLGTMMGVPINWFCNSVLVTQPGGYEQMGIFNAANQWRMIILFLPATVGSVLLPIMTRVYGQGDYLHHTKMLRLSIFLNSGVALLLALPLMVFARPVLCMYGAGFSSGETAFFLLMLGAIVIAVNNGMSRAIVSLGRIKTDLLFHIIWGAVFLLTGWLLIPRFGLNGLALATILGALLQGACQWIWLMAHYRNRSRVAHSG